MAVFAGGDTSVQQVMTGVPSPLRVSALRGRCGPAPSPPRDGIDAFPCESKCLSLVAGQWRSGERPNARRLYDCFRVGAYGIPFGVTEMARILDRAEQGDPKAAEELLPLVYDQLRKLAAGKMSREAAGHTLQPTDLVHEAWLRLQSPKQQNWNGKGHFFSAAAEAMRRILIERVRRKRAIRHGGDHERIALDEIELSAGETDDRLLQIHEGLDALAEVDERQAEIVKLRFFVGLNLEEIAVLQGTSAKTVQRQWNHAKAWLVERLQSGA